MKTTDVAEVVRGAMPVVKPQGSGQRAIGGGGRKTSGLTPASARSGSIPSAIPLEWMDPMSWRLPSGKALAEFALQTGFLAPLMLSGPEWKKKKAVPRAAAVAAVEKDLAGPSSEASKQAGTFRGTR